MEELLKLLLEEAESLERSYWYESGYDVQSEALRVLSSVLKSTLSRVQEGE